jgi:hypothetical protein
MCSTPNHVFWLGVLSYFVAGCEGNRPTAPALRLVCTKYRTKLAIRPRAEARLYEISYKVGHPPRAEARLYEISYKVGYPPPR